MQQDHFDDKMLLLGTRFSGSMCLLTPCDDETVFDDCDEFHTDVPNNFDLNDFLDALKMAGFKNADTDRSIQYMVEEVLEECLR